MMQGLVSFYEPIKYYSQLFEHISAEIVNFIVSVEHREELSLRNPRNASMPIPT